MMAFLTMIAPMVALTYPLDKIKDGKAQALNFWVREYVFNCIMQPVHLLIYTVLISSAITFTEGDPNFLYAIAAMAFMLPAEKFIKSMFGLKSETQSTSMGAAAAGGALVMSLLNKIKPKGPKESKESSSGTANVRTANNNGASSVGNQNSGNANTNKSNSTTNTANNGNAKAGTSASNTQKNTQSGINAAKQPYSKIAGMKAVGKKILGPQPGRRFTRTVAGALTGVAAGTVALAANIADGDIIDDPTKAAKEIGATGLVGYHAGSNLTGRAMHGASNVYQTYKEGAYSEEPMSNHYRTIADATKQKGIQDKDAFIKWAKENNMNEEEAKKLFKKVKKYWK